MIERIFKLPTWILAAGSIAMITLLCTYSWYHEKDEHKNLKDKITQSHVNAGEKVYLDYVIVLEKNDREIVVKNRRGDIYILFPSDNIEQDKYYSFLGEINPDGRIKIIIERQRTKWELKHILSLLSLILVIYYCLRYIRFSKDSYQLYIIKRKNNA